MHVSLLWAFDEYFLIEVELLCAVVLIECLHVIDIIRVGIGIGEGKFDLLVLILK